MHNNHCHRKKNPFAVKYVIVIIIIIIIIIIRLCRQTERGTRGIARFILNLEAK